MQSAEYYRGREQTYLKHFFLERYLERVAYNIGWGNPEFVYIDGFSGPWRSKHEALEDTSFMIAINKLRDVREGLQRQGKSPKIRCLFIERDPTAFLALQRAIAGVKDMEVRAELGDFENHIETAREFAGSAFTLTFIDPTGWTGFGLNRIAPLLRMRGEVIVNFMFGHLNRFLDGSRTDLKATFDDLFGGTSWEAAVADANDREESIIRAYCERVRAIGDFTYVTSTRIMQPLAERSYFYLVYATRHYKGLVEFRGIEKKFVDVQESLRVETKELERLNRSGQPSLFTTAELVATAKSYTERRDANRVEARSRVVELLSATSRLEYQEVLATALELPLVWRRDVGELVFALRNEGMVAIDGMGAKERTLKPQHALRWLGSN